MWCGVSAFGLLGVYNCFPHAFRTKDECMRAGVLGVEERCDGVEKVTQEHDRSGEVS
jgi:hypothetical protein